jgi:ABC-type multidrug transport system fused ATPase/permease subunit
VKDWREILYGLLVLVMMLVRPQGLLDAALLARLSPRVSGPLLTVEGLSRSFGSLVVLAGLDLTVEAGGIHAIIGPNGAGKTTFFNLVTGALDAGVGRIRFDGVDIAACPRIAAPRSGSAAPSRTSGSSAR